MQLEEKNLRDLLSGEAAKEKRAYKRASLLTVIAAVVGLVWLAFSASNVYRLQRKSSDLSRQIGEQTTKLSELQSNINSAHNELGETMHQLEVANEALKGIKKHLETIAAGTKDPKAQAKEALRIATNATKTVNGGVKNVKSVPQASETSPPANPSTRSGWVIVVGGDKDLDAAKTRSRRVQSLGYDHTLICQRQGFWRTLAIFPSKALADANLSKIGASFKEEKPYTRELNKWCLNLMEPESGICKCQN